MIRCKELVDSIENRSFPLIDNQDKTILVSIIVINRNGLQHLQTLVPALLKSTTEINYELIIVDNASTDCSVDYVRNFFEKHSSRIPLQIIQNNVNEPFSVANNAAVKIAKGKYLVLLNNDIEPLAGWLNYLLEQAESKDNIGSIGARLVYPYQIYSRFKNIFKRQINSSCQIQHAGIAFSFEGSQFRPYNLGKGKALNAPDILKSGNKSALTAACLLVPKAIYVQVGGLDEAYNYGGEDVDLGLKLLKAGYINYYCADSVLFHHEFGTQGKEKRREVAKRRKKNLQIFQNKWYVDVKKHYWTEKIYSESNLYAESPLTIAVLDDKSEVIKINESVIQSYGWKLIQISKKQSKDSKANTQYDFMLVENKTDSLSLYNDQFTVSVKSEGWLKHFRDILIRRYLNPSIVIKIPTKTWKGAYSWGDYHMALLLKEQLEKIGHYVLLQIYPEWYNDEGLECDVAIVLRGLSRYNVKRQQINIMWNISHPDDIALDEYEDYDKVYIASNYWSKKIAERVSVPVEVMLQCTDTGRFREPSEKQKIENNQQLLFVGNSRDVYRKILKDLLPTDYKLAVYGRNWNKILPKKIIKGEYIANDELYKHYGSADILLNDHWDDMRDKGFVSNRIFDGLACGAFILSDKVKEMGQLEEYVQVYETKEELKELLAYYLVCPKERSKRVLEGKNYVAEHHTYKERAKIISKSVHSLMEGRLNRKI